MNKIRWGVMGAAKIAVNKVIPAMQRSEYAEVTAIASRRLETAQALANQFHLMKAFGSYEELLLDQDLDAIYIPLPNHLHVPWSIKALEAGKHVLCEKPIGLTSTEAEQLVEVAQQHPKLKLMEAFMYRLHPQWQTARDMVNQGKIGTLVTIQSFFSYFNDDPNNIRNMAEIGGGGLMDIGCYSISLSRFIFASEPERVFGIVDNDPRFNTDRVASGILDFGQGTSTFTCATQLAPHQRVNLFGTDGRIEILIPFNAPSDQPCKILHQHGDKTDEIVFDVCDQYAIQADLFSRAILDDTEPPTPIEDAVHNMKVIEAIIESGRTGAWVSV